MRSCCLKLTVTLLAGAVAAGCGGNEPAGKSDGGMLAPGSLLPIKEGNSWTYRVTDGAGVTTMKTQTVMAKELVGGTGPHKDVMAWKMVTKKHMGMATTVDETDSWQALVGTQVVRYRELAYHATTGAVEQEEYWQPPKLRVDEDPARMKMGVEWLEIYQETKLPVSGTAATAEQRDLWTVESASQSITLAGQTFNALVLRKIAGTTKDYWFVPGVGKVKETGDQTEELMSYQVTP